jgi:tRNA (cmo5U34)-methyltransferase
VKRPESAQDWSDPDWARWFESHHAEGNAPRAAHLELLPDVLEPAGPGWVLDLGCGPAVVAETLLDRLPDIRLWGLDSSPPMLELAAPRLARFGDRARLVACDLTRVDTIEAPDGCAAAIAVQSLHHIGRLQGPLFGWVRDRLRPGGWFLLIDRVAIPGPRLYEPFRRAKERLGQGRNAESWLEYHEDLELNGDHPLTVPELVSMLTEAGFEAGCLDARADRAFIVARR